MGMTKENILGELSCSSFGQDGKVEGMSTQHYLIPERKCFRKRMRWDPAYMMVFTTRRELHNDFRMGPIP